MSYIVHECIYWETMNRTADTDNNLKQYSEIFQCELSLFLTLLLVNIAFMF